MPQGMSPLEYKRGKKVLRFDCGIDRVLIAGKEIIAGGNPDEGGKLRGTYGDINFLWH